MWVVISRGSGGFQLNRRDSVFHEMERRTLGGYVPEKDDPPPKAHRRKSTLLWIGAGIFLSFWMFCLGVLVGRGWAPVQFDVKSLQQELSNLKKAAIDRSLHQFETDAKSAESRAGLKFYEVLKGSKDTPPPSVIPDSKAKSVSENPMGTLPKSATVPPPIPPAKPESTLSASGEKVSPKPTSSNAKPGTAPVSGTASPAPAKPGGTPPATTEKSLAKNATTSLKNGAATPTPPSPGTATSSTATTQKPAAPSTAVAQKPAATPPATVTTQKPTTPPPTAVTPSPAASQKPATAPPATAQKPAPTVASVNPPTVAPPAGQKPPAVPEKPVKVEPTAGNWTIQVLSVKDSAEADRILARLRQQGYPATKLSSEIPGKGVWYRLRLGPYKRKEEVDFAVTRLQKEGFSPMTFNSSGTKEPQ
jgi:cell division protein FtsN